MVSKDQDVQDVLGVAVWTFLLNAVINGSINATAMLAIADLLPPVVSGGHRRRVENGESNEAEWRRMLCDWHNEEMYAMNQRSAIEKLIGIFLDPAVHLPPLAQKLESELPGNNKEMSGVRKYSAQDITMAEEAAKLLGATTNTRGTTDQRRKQSGGEIDSGTCSAHEDEERTPFPSPKPSRPSSLSTSPTAPASATATPSTPAPTAAQPSQMICLGSIVTFLVFYRLRLLLILLLLLRAGCC